MLRVDQIDRLIARRRVYAIAGAGLMLLAIVLPGGWKFGVLTGFMLLSLAVYCRALRDWRTDRGLWMLACLLVCLFAPCLAGLQYEYWRSHFAQQPGPAITWQQILLSIDALLALVIMAIIVKLAVAVAVENWNVSAYIAAQKLNRPANAPAGRLSTDDDKVGDQASR